MPRTSKVRTSKEVSAEIKALQQELVEIEKKEFYEKYEELIPVLNETSLTIAQIKKAIKDAEKEKSGTVKNKRTASASKKKSGFSPKKCTVCGEDFIPKGGRQTICDDCKAKQQEQKKKDKEKVTENKEKTTDTKFTLLSDIG